MRRIIRRKKLFIVLLLIYLCFNIALGILFWRSTTKAESLYLRLGENDSIEVVEVLSCPDKTLIPITAIAKDNDVKEVILQYNVKLNSKTVKEVELNVEAINVMIGESLELGSLVNFEIIKVREIANKLNAQVTVKVTLSEPKDYLEYESVVNKPIKFTVKLSAV
ncbi:MAG: hypothetical protein ACOX4W_05320 [Bacilli bacterium]|jgi:adenylate cyclase class IV